jgi:hypothetical protein
MLAILLCFGLVYIHLCAAATYRKVVGGSGGGADWAQIKAHGVCRPGGCVAVAADASQQVRHGVCVARGGAVMAPWWTTSAAVTCIQQVNRSNNRATIGERTVLGRRTAGLQQ